MTRTVVMWFRRDLRLADLPALQAAAADGANVVPLFVVDPTFARAGLARRAFMAEALQALDDSAGGALVYRHGKPSSVVATLAAEVGASAVYVSGDHSPYGRARDAEVARALDEAGTHLVEVGTPYAVQPGAVVKADGRPYSVFSPFSRAWRRHRWPEPGGVPEVDWCGAPSVPCDGPPDLPQVDIDFTGAGEAAAHAQWEAFLPRIATYKEDRDLPALDATSRLSAALKWGLVHPRQLLADLGTGEGDESFATELAWREFYADVVHHRPRGGWENLDRRMDAMPVDTDEEARSRMRRWAAGLTGYPIVDAGMRQLLATGWMHNRVRMVVASFLVKDLHLPWQWGARYFMGHLIDGDLASNSLGWQWVAGTGTDAAPYFRIFNPTTQGRRFDPEGDYVRRWVPELAAIKGAGVHEPGLRRPDDYPPPMVDHRSERDEALLRYRVVTSGSR
jgi:deoxyribodipyrimidine photo-lyase